MTNLTFSKRSALLLFVGSILAVISACQKSPEVGIVHDLVAAAVKSSLEPHLGPVKVSVEKYVLGEAFTNKDAFGDRSYFPCKAIYTTVDPSGAINKDCVWLGNLTMDEFGKWIAIPFRIPISR